MSQLSALVHVADTGSFTSAAARIGVSQPTVTTRIRALENELGISLFQRMPRGIRTTRPGRVLLSYAHRITELNESARNAVASSVGMTGTILIGAADDVISYRLLPLIEYVSLRFPDVQLSIKSGNRDEITTAVQDGRLDCAFFMDVSQEPDIVDSKVLCGEPLVLVAGPANPLADIESLTVEYLREATLLCSERSTAYHRVFEELLRKEQDQDLTVFELGSLDAVKHAIAAGIGIAILPEVVVATELQDGSLRRLTWVPPFSAYTGMMWCTECALNPVADAILGAAWNVVDEQLGRG